jgi:hypothetical protein
MGGGLCEDMPTRGKGRRRLGYEVQALGVKLMHRESSIEYVNASLRRYHFLRGSIKNFLQLLSWAIFLKFGQCGRGC